MPNEDYQFKGIDLTALKNQMEGQLVGSLLRMGGTTTEAQYKWIMSALKVFERHGVGALEAINIMREIGELPNDQK